MRCSSLCFAVLLLALARTADAECLVCDEVVEIDSARAACFLGNHASIAQSVAVAPNGRMPIDLDACTVGGDKLDMRGAIADLPSLEDVPLNVPDRTEPIKSVYLLDSASVECLKVLIETHSGPLDPVATFDLFEQCQP